jgi:hypothetical protein
MQVDMLSLKARLGQVEAERAQLAARLEDTRLGAEADLQRLSSTLCEQVSASQLQQVKFTSRHCFRISIRRSGSSMLG